jgi:hypothetical protein
MSDLTRRGFVKNSAAATAGPFALVSAGRMAGGRARARAVDGDQNRRALVHRRHVEALALRADVDPQPHRHRFRG